MDELRAIADLALDKAPDYLKPLLRERIATVLYWLVWDLVVEMQGRAAEDAIALNRRRMAIEAVLPREAPTEDMASQVQQVRSRFRGEGR